MMIESDIIISAMNYVLDKGIGCLSIHDCLIVPEESTQVAIDAFPKPTNTRASSHHSCRSAGELNRISKRNE